MTTLQQMAEGQNNAHVVFNEAVETLSAGGIFGKNPGTTSGLVWGYLGGLYNGNTIADGTVTQTNTADNYVVVLRSTGVVSVSTSSANSLNALYAKLYKNTCAGGVVTVSVDQRWDVNGLLFNTAGLAGGDMILASVQTVTGAKTFGSAGAVGKLIVAGTTSGTTIIDAAAVAGTTTVTLPGATGTLLSTAAAVTVAQGGTGVATLTAYAPVFGGTTGTGAVQSGTAGTSGQVLTSNGAGVLPTFQAAAASRVGVAFEKELALSDLTTAITTGTTKAYFRPAFAASGVSARASLRVASSSGIPTVDMNKAGATMMSTKLTIDASELTSVTAAVPVVMSTTTWAIDDLIEFDIDVAGTGAMGLIVTVTGLYA